MLARDLAQENLELVTREPIGQGHLENHHVNGLGLLTHEVCVEVGDVDAALGKRRGDRVHDSGVIGAVERDHVRGIVYSRLRRIDLGERDGLQLELRARALEVVAQHLQVGRTGGLEHQHHGEVTAENRHLRVGEVDAVAKQRAGHLGHNPGPVTSNC